MLIKALRIKLLKSGDRIYDFFIIQNSASYILRIAKYITNGYVNPTIKVLEYFPENNEDYYAIYRASGAITINNYKIFNSNDQLSLRGADGEELGGKVITHVFKVVFKTSNHDGEVHVNYGEFTPLNFK